MSKPAAHLDLGAPELRDRWPEELAALISVIEAALAEAGESKKRARELAHVAVRAVARYHGGRMFYLPKGDRLERALRDRAIWEEFDGRNQLALARRHKLTDVQIYAILREQRQLARRRANHDLFPAGDD